MQLSPQSQTIFQSLFMEKSKEQSNSIQLYKQAQATKARERYVKNQIDRPNTSLIQKINEIDCSQTQYERHRRISMNESQLTVVTIRKPQKQIHTIELSPQITPLSSFQSQRKYSKIQQTEKNTVKVKRINSPEQEKQINFKQKQYRNKLQLKNAESNDQKLKQYVKEYRSNSKGVQEYIKYQDEMDEYFKDKLFQQQKRIMENIDYFKIKTKRIEQQLEPIGKVLENKLKQLKRKT